MHQNKAGVIRGVYHGINGFRLILEPNIRNFVIVPLLISTAVFFGALAAFGMAFDYGIDRYLSDWNPWAQWLLWIMFGALTLIFIFSTFALLANLIASPFNAALSEAVERHLNPDTEIPDFLWSNILSATSRTTVAELRKLKYFGIRAIPLMALSVTPLANVLAPFLWLVFGAWILSLEYLDCPLGNHGRLFPSAVVLLRSQRRLALGFGGFVTLLTMVPLINCLAMPIGVAGATSMYYEQFSNDNDNDNGSSIL